MDSTLHPRSAEVHYGNNARHGDVLTFAPGRNAYDHAEFRTGDIPLSELVDATYFPHADDPAKGSLMTSDGRHVAVPHLVGRLVEASRTARRLGVAVAGVGAAAAGAVAVAGGAPGTFLAVAGAGVAVRVAAWASGACGRGAVAGLLSEAREEVASREVRLERLRRGTDESVAALMRAAASLRDASLDPAERLGAAFDERPAAVAGGPR